jgi:hypothetical protein
MARPIATPDEELAALLGADPVARPPPEVEARLAPRAEADGAPEPLAREARWWRAVDAARAGDWEAVGALAEQGLAEPWSEREAVRLAFLHCLSGSLEEAEHVLSQAVQSGADEGLLRRFAGWCAREGLPAAAARFGLGG